MLAGGINRVLMGMEAEQRNLSTPDFFSLPLQIYFSTLFSEQASGGLTCMDHINRFPCPWLLAAKRKGESEDTELIPFILRRLTLS